MGAGSFEEYPVGEGGLAAAKQRAAWYSARSFREALPLFLRSRKYSQVRPNSEEKLAGVFVDHLKTNQRSESMEFRHHT